MFDVVFIVFVFMPLCFDQVKRFQCISVCLHSLVPTCTDVRVIVHFGGYSSSFSKLEQQNLFSMTILQSLSLIEEVGVA